MSDLKISQMPDAGALSGTEVIPLVQSGGNVKAALTVLKAYFGGGTVTSVCGVAPISGNVALSYTNVGADAAGSAAAAQASAEAYADSLVVGLWDDRGNYNPASGNYPSTGGSGSGGAVKKGDIWTISASGTLPTGQVVEQGDTVRALIDSPGNTQANWAIAQNNIGYTPANSTTQVIAGNGLSGGGTLTGNVTLSLPNVGTAGTYGGQAKTLTVTTDAYGRVSAVTESPVGPLLSPIQVVYIDTDFAPTRATSEPTVTDQIFIPGVIKTSTVGRYDIRADNTLYGSNFPNTIGLACVDNGGLATGVTLGLSTSQSTSLFTPCLNVANGTVTWYAGLGLACLNAAKSAELTLTTGVYYHAGLLSGLPTSNISITGANIAAICFSGGMNSGNWLAVCQTSNTNSTSVDTGVACVQDVMHLFEIKATSSSVQFWIDGTPVATITTDIPSTAGDFLNASITTWATGNCGFVVDNWRVVKVTSFTRNWVTH